ncbi:MAG TPA: FliM/FliN family flagellar motor switch protein [Candidatus Aquilonibacter sp.]|nr:FliM/FliN family flagellar motor switch protein [Candidatus Aquilonibacter sp.]
MTAGEKALPKPSPAPSALPTADDSWGELRFVNVSVSVDVPIVGLTVRELFRLEKGSIVFSAQQSGANAPVKIGETVLAWGEFNVMDAALALRVVELA